MNLKEQLYYYLQNDSSIDIANREVLIYGAGNTTVLYRNCFAEEGINPKYYIDKNEKKHNTLFQNKQVIYPEDINTLCFEPIVLVSTQQREYQIQIQELLNEIGVENYLIDDFIFKRHGKDILDVYESLEDELSKDTYATMILARMGKEVSLNSVVCPNTYFGLPEFQTMDGGEVFVDCGAYVGDTIEQYINMRSGMFGQIYAVEPETKNFYAMEQRVKRLNAEWALGDQKIVLVNAGIAKEEGELYLNTVEEGSPSLSASLSKEKVKNKIQIISLDQYFMNRRVDFIKADIEGYEAEMLGGGIKIIQKNRPLMAICIYHNAYDMYRIAKLIRSMRADYKIAVRQHQFSLLETVLYAY